LKPVDITIVIPVFNERENLEILMEEVTCAMKSVEKTYEIVCVNDCSTDGSLDVLKKLKAKDNRIRIISFKRNHGLTSALDAGFKSAGGDIVAMLDADLQNDPADLPAMFEQIKRFDVVCGWRKKRRDTFVKKISSKIANAVRRAFTGDKYHDIACGIKVFRRRCVSDMTMYNGLHRFFPILMELDGYTVTEIVVNHRNRYKGTSKYAIGNRLFRSLYDLIAVKWMINRRLTYKEDSNEL
jgi:glycosyltransferase involved in cell wall biosynthesis